MPNLSNATREEMQAHEAKLELSNRIHLRERLNHLMLHPNSDMEDILNLAKLINEMVELSLKKQKLDYADEKALSRDRELSLAESRVEVQKESQAIARAKMAAKQVSPEKAAASQPPTSSSQSAARTEQAGVVRADADEKQRPTHNLTSIPAEKASTSLGAPGLSQVNEKAKQAA